jgi:DNA repair protein RecN (Recombination protein N)
MRHNIENMLVELLVENYAVIEKVRVRFDRGLNILTGETGSGKSIVVDALNLLFGGRASAEMIRTGAEKARISGIFEVTSLPPDLGIELEENELLLEREILAGGKSRAFAQSRPVTMALLKELAPFLGDIHGQHDQQQLFSPSVQREILDGFAGADDLSAETAGLFGRWRSVTSELEDLDRTAQQKLREKDMWIFQRNEIEGVAPKAGEDTDLENERRVLRNVVRIQETGSAAYAALYEDPESVVTQLKAVHKRLEELARIDDNISGVIAALQPAAFAADEAAQTLRHYLERLEADPARLDEVESRMAALEKLKRKYGSSLEEVLAFVEQVKQDIAAVETSSERRDALEKQAAELTRAYEAAAKRLSAKRKEAAKQLARRVETELGALAMDKSRVEIRVVEAPWSAAGADAIEFLISPNPGEEPKPLEKIASGGELSRVALALKTCAVPQKQNPTAVPRTLVFDEVDAGVGGSAAEAVGRRLKRLSRTSQVLCVTHLAQIAGFADHHYHVEKTAAKGRTVASIEELTPESRTREIGRMLSGERLTPEALKHAEQLLKLAAE